MSESPNNLRSIKAKEFLQRSCNFEDLEELCFDLEIKFDELSGATLTTKIIKLLQYCGHHNKLDDVEIWLSKNRSAYSIENINKAQQTILASTPNVRDAFIEFNRQIDSYLRLLGRLYDQLEQRKEIHNMVQDVQNTFAPCRIYIVTKGNKQIESVEMDRLLSQIEGDWRPCQAHIKKLGALFKTFDPAKDESEDISEKVMLSELPKLFEEARAVGDVLLRGDVNAVLEKLSIFGNQVDELLYLADKSLRALVKQIEKLPKPTQQRGDDDYL